MKEKVIRVRMAERTLARLHAVSERLDLSISDLVRRGTEDALPKFEKLNLPGAPKPDETRVD